MSGLVIVRSVRLSNILSHVNTYVEFPLGLTALVGPNGAGKSSIVDSIVYALFINPQNIRGFRGSSKKSFLRIGASSGSIEIELSIGGKRYTVFRGISADRGDEAVLYEVAEDGRKRVIASGVQATLDYIKKLLSIPSADSLRYTVISRQSEVAGLLEETQSTRKELVLKLLGLDELEKSKELLKEYLDRVNSDKVLFDKLKVDLAEVRKKIQEVQRTVELWRSELGKLEEEMARLNESVSQYEKLLGLFRRYSTLSKAMEIASRLKELEKVIPVCREIMGFDLDRYVSAAKMLEEGRKGFDEALRRLEELDKRIRDYIAGMSRDLGIDVDVYDPSKAIELLEDAIRRMDLDKSFKQAELNIATNSINVVEISTRCPLCGRELNEDLKERILADAEHRTRKLSEELSRLSTLYSKARRHLDELKRLERARIEWQAKADAYRRRLDEATNTFKEVREEAERVMKLAGSTNTFSKCVARESPDIDSLRCLQRLAIEISKAYEERASVVRRLVGEDVSIEEVADEYNRVRDQIRELGFDVERIDIGKVEQEYKEFIGRLNSLRETAGITRGRIESYSRILNELIEKERDLEDRIASLRKSVELHTVLDILVNKILGKDGLLAKALTAEAKRLMERYANAVLKELGMDLKVRIGEDFSIDVSSSYGELDVRSLSGGETVSLAIALRIALAYTVFGRLPGFFILDEPTQFLDAERRRTVFEIIKRLSEKIPQVIVVTHDPEVVELADKVFYVSKEGGRSVVKEREKAFEPILKE